MPELNSLTAPIKIGDVAGGNYQETRIDGTIRLLGGATCWKDMVADLFGRRLSSTTGKVDYDWDENAITFQPGGSISNSADRVGGNQQINHEFKVGTGQVFSPHIHLFQEIASSANVIDAVFTLRYRVQNNNAAKTTSWTAITATLGTDDIFDFTGEGDGTYNQLLPFPNISINCAISDTIQYQMARTDSEIGNVLVYFMDTHGEVDSHGSDGIISKAA